MSVTSSVRCPPHAYVEDYPDSEPEPEPEPDESDATTLPTKPAANAGRKRSDPTIASKTKYAPSDSGYSSLTTTTASSSQSRPSNINEPPSHHHHHHQQHQQHQQQHQHHHKQTSTIANPLKKVAKAFRNSTREKETNMDFASAPAPPSQTRPRRKQDLSLRTVESREEAARMHVGGPTAHIITERSPVSATSTMPGAFPPSPTGAVASSAGFQPSVPRAIPRTRKSSTTYRSSRPTSMYEPGSLTTPVFIPIAQPQAHPQPVVYSDFGPASLPSVPMYEPPPPPPPPSYATSSSYFVHPPYVPTPTSAPAVGQPAFQYPPPAQNQPAYNVYATPVHHHQAPQWNPDPHHFSIPPTAQPLQPPVNRRLSMAASGDYAIMDPHFEQPMFTQQPHYPAALEYQRRYSSTAAPMSQSPFKAPPVVDPYDEALVDDEDYYRQRRTMPPPPRPQPRPPLQARTTSAIHANRLSRSSMEYSPYDTSPREPSFELQRPALTQKYHTSTATSRGHQQEVYHEPRSPLRRRHGSLISNSSQAEQLRLEHAEAHMSERSGGHTAQVTTGDIPLSRRSTRNSETGSRGSSSREGNEAKRNKRISRHSIDKQRLRDSYHEKDGGLTVTVSYGGATATGSSSRPPSRSTKPHREPSRVRSGGHRRTTEGGTGTGGGSGSGGSGGSSGKPRMRDRDEVEAPRPRRSSSVQPQSSTRAGYGVDELTKSLKSKLKMEDSRARDSRSSSRSARTRK